uniref:RNA methyltransferase n=1 Tax=Glossina brevipalpis TaxID=37001 RepID=A0A1A9X1S8_9MUSC
MDLSCAQTYIEPELVKQDENLKETTEESLVKKRRIENKSDQNSKEVKVAKVTKEDLPSCSKTRTTEQRCSPRKRLDVQTSNEGIQEKSVIQRKKCKQKFIYGNYSKYYGYRNMGKVFHDVRLDVFDAYCNLFAEKRVLDIGCNAGILTIEVAKRFKVKSIIGLDIDRHLIDQAFKVLNKQKKLLPLDNECKKLEIFPFNINFVHGNYVLKDDVLLEIEKPQFQMILCLSLTKWIHLNFGDKGLKQAFKRMYLQLEPQGVLILEAQSFNKYAKRKKITDTIYRNYQAIQFFPQDFHAYLLSTEVGFKSCELMGLPAHCKAGFQRPIYIFYK